MLRPTRSRDGLDRVTIRMEVRLTREQIIDLLAARAVNYGVDEVSSATAAERVLREHIDYEVRDAVQGVEPGADDEDKAWAERLADLLWPERG